MLSWPYIFRLSKCKTTFCVYSQLIFFVSACRGCVEKMQKQMHVLGAWRRALHASLCLTRMQQFLRGQVRVEVAVMLPSVAGFLTDGRRFLGRQCCFLLQHILVWKAFVEHPRITEVLSPSTWNFYGIPKVPQLLHSLPLPCAGTDTDNVSKSCFFKNICPYEAVASISPNQEGFLSWFASKKAFLAIQKCVGGSKKHTGKHFCCSVKWLLSCHPLGIAECS